MEAKKWSFVQRVVAILSSLCIGATIFGFGFSLGDKWGYYQNSLLKEHIETQNNEIKHLSETVGLYEKSKNDLTTLVNKIDEQNLFFISSAQGAVVGETVLTKKLSYGEALSYKGIIYFSFAGFQSEQEQKYSGSDQVKFAKGKIDFSVGTYRTESKHFILQVGDSIRFILDGNTYVVLLKQLSMPGISPSYLEDLKLDVEIEKIR
jgi:hypothetical protein